MRGDFSSWRFEREQNFSGVLHQQGRVLLDSDWNAQTAMTNDWQDTAGQDVIGAGVAAVPAMAPDGFRIRKAEVKNITGGQRVELTVAPGRVWADGLLAHIYGQTDGVRLSWYLQPPVQTTPGQVSDIEQSLGNTPNLKDAVVLEVWREEINGFQLPEMLIEPALGGPDTTERVHTAMAFSLMRLGANDTCENISGRLKDKFAEKGRLTASLAPAEISDGDCPVARGGGYTGFEHNLYRIEIARVNGNAPMFKWSQMGGGLVGRGRFDAVNLKVEITANSQAIITSGLNNFYLEALEYEPSAPGLGHWRVTYGATVTLNHNGELALPDPGVAGSGTMFGAIPTPADPSNPALPGTVFFRLWNAIHPISDFSPGPIALQDGIHLAFDSTSQHKYTPGDYWTFPVRAGEIDNPAPLVNNQPPEGIHYHRVPLAILEWRALTLTPEQGTIEDCRHIFQPLTRLRLATCCTYHVGDGTHSYGDFDSIQEAINHLPPAGDEVCVLPGEYRESIKIDRKQNITVKGCGGRSRIVSPAPAQGTTAAPVIHVRDSQNIKIESLEIAAHTSGIGILLEGPTPVEVNQSQGERRLLREITLEKLHVTASTRSAIEAHVGYFIIIRDCDLEMMDVPTIWPGLFFVGEDALVENNVIHVARKLTPQSFGVAGIATGLDTSVPASAALGGMQLGGTSERVRVINNLIHGGIGNGITLGSLEEVEGPGIRLFMLRFHPWWKMFADPCDPCDPGSVFIPFEPQAASGKRHVSSGALYEIHVERNRIFNMGLNGIGVAGFFDLRGVDEFISVHGLFIAGNVIRHCLNRQLASIPGSMIDSMGYGGISLGDVDYLVIRDNLIEDNGPDQLEALCGIFVLHGEGIEISRNRILNNGMKRENAETDPSRAKPGRRSGINIVFAIAPVTYSFVATQEVRRVGSRVPVQKIPIQNGVPAVKVHENIVSVPLGQALSLTALGPVSVVGNQFTSRGVVPDSGAQTFQASTVYISNLGVSNERNGQLVLYSGIQKGQATAPGVRTTEGSITLEPRPGLDDQRSGQYVMGGNVLFSNNQCVLDLIDMGASLSSSSIAILSLDDIGFHNNQCDCNLLDDFVIFQTILFGNTLRASDNRFKEGINNAICSAATLGFLNITTDNQATHCLLVMGNMVDRQRNQIYLAAFDSNACQGLSEG
jgi:hypothetical protein